MRRPLSAQRHSDGDPVNREARLYDECVCEREVKVYKIKC